MPAAAHSTAAVVTEVQQECAKSERDPARPRAVGQDERVNRFGSTSGGRRAAPDRGEPGTAAVVTEARRRSASAPSGCVLVVGVVARDLDEAGFRPAAEGSLVPRVRVDGDGLPAVRRAASAQGCGPRRASGRARALRGRGSHRGRHAAARRPPTRTAGSRRDTVRPRRSRHRRASPGAAPASPRACTSRRPSSGRPRGRRARSTSRSTSSSEPAGRSSAARDNVTRR